MGVINSTESKRQHDMAVNEIREQDAMIKPLKSQEEGLRRALLMCKEKNVRLVARNILLDMENEKLREAIRSLGADKGE